MNRLPIAIVGTTIAITTGCSSAGQNNTPTPASSASVGKPSHAEPATSIEKAENSKAKLAELIPSTDPSRRLDLLQQGRSDPFTRLASQPAEHLPVVSPAQVKAQVPLPPPPPSETSSARPNKVETPQADVARKIAVLGVIQIGNRSYAIIKQPQDVTTRYVTEGQTLSNSSIKVKKISIGSDFGTQVVFEENGTEVSKAVDGVEVATAIEPEPIISHQDKAARLVATNTITSPSISSFAEPDVIKRVRSSVAQGGEAPLDVNRLLQQPKKSFVLRVPSLPGQQPNVSTSTTKRNTVKLKLRSALISVRNPSPSTPQSHPFPKQTAESQQPAIQLQPTELLFTVRSPAQLETESNREFKRQQLLSQLRGSMSSTNNPLASASLTVKVQTLKQQRLISQLRGNNSEDSKFNAE